jgi:hypothetical protein
VAAVLALFFLVAARNPGFWGYLLRRPGALDGESVRLWLAYGLWPALIAAGIWAAARFLGRRALTALGARPETALDGVIAAALGLGLLAEACFLLGWAR